MGIRGYAKHLAQIMNTWEGSEVTLNVRTLTRDGDGQVTKVEYTPYTVVGSFPAMPKTLNKSKTGYIDEGEITTYIMCTTGIPIPNVEDKIIFDGNWFEIQEEPKIDYDGGVEIGYSCILKRVPNED